MKTSAEKKQKAAAELSQKAQLKFQHEDLGKEAREKATKLEEKAHKLGIAARHAENRQKSDRERHMKMAQKHARALDDQANELSEKADRAQSHSDKAGFRVKYWKAKHDHMTTHSAADAWEHASDLANQAAEVQQKYQAAKKGQVATAKKVHLRTKQVAMEAKMKQADASKAP